MSGVAEARRKRDEVKLKIHEGTDPLAERKCRKPVGKFKTSNCFGDLAEEYIAMVTREGWSEATIEKTKWLFEKLRPIAGTPIAAAQRACVTGDSDLLDQTLPSGPVNISCGGFRNWVC